MLARRAAFFADKVCVKCGATEQLELDHIDRRQKKHHAIWSWSEKRREAEIAKCQVLCRECHIDKTYEARDYPVGMERPGAKLNDEAVIEIWNRLRAGERPTAICDDYGVSKHTISNIKLGRNWTHITENLPPLPSGGLTRRRR